MTEADKKKEEAKKKLFLELQLQVQQLM